MGGHLLVLLFGLAPCPAKLVFTVMVGHNVCFLCLIQTSVLPFLDDLFSAAATAQEYLTKSKMLHCILPCFSCLIQQTKCIGCF